MIERLRYVSHFVAAERGYTGAVWSDLWPLYIVGTAFVLGLGGRLEYLYRQPERRAGRALRAMPATTIARVKDGRIVKIVGDVVAERGGTVEAPLSRRACVYYSLVVEQYRATPAGSNWHAIIEERRGVDFLLRDESDVALVRIGAGDVPSLRPDRNARLPSFAAAREDLERLLADRGRPAEGLVSGVEYRAHEAVVIAGGRTAVGGLARRLPNPEAARGYRDAPTLVVLQGTESHPLLLSNDASAFS